MKTFAVVLLIALCVVDLGMCAENRRLQEPVSTGVAILAIIKTLAGNTQVTVDANKLFDQVKGTLKSGSKNGCIVLNLDSKGKEHTFYAMPDVVNFGGLIHNPITCAFGTHCVVYKMSTPMSSSKIKVGVDGKNGAGAFKGKFYYLDEGLVYNWTGAGFNPTGNMKNWREALDHRRRLFRHQH
jgi:hypothetical protein